MMEVSKSEVGNVTVATTSNTGLSIDHWAERATNTIVSVGSQSHPLIAEQANAFKADVFATIKYYMEEAVSSSKTTAIAELEQSGYFDMAEILRKM
jgi:hypothetical protein|tara:strand:- start:99 stop:386 length:288 start_codon:yes stop_codon:yes gene_type:complete